MKKFKFKKKNKDVVKTFVDKWKAFDNQRHEALVEMSSALEKTVKNEALRRLVVNELIKEGFRKVEDGGLVLSKKEVLKYAELEMLSIENLENYVKYSEIKAKLELIEWIIKLFAHNTELFRYQEQFYELFVNELKDQETLTEVQQKQLNERFFEVYEEINNKE